MLGIDGEGWLLEIWFFSLQSKLENPIFWKSTQHYTQWYSLVPYERTWRAYKNCYAIVQKADSGYTKKTQPSYNLRKIKVLDILDMKWLFEYQLW